MLAGIAEGLINAALIPQMTGAADPKFQAVKAAPSYNFQLNQACAKVFVVGSSLAIVLWSIGFFTLATGGRGLEFSAALSVSLRSPVCSLVILPCRLMALA